VAGDVVTAGTADHDVTHDLPETDERVTSSVGAPAGTFEDTAAAESDDSDATVAETAAEDEREPEQPAGRGGNGRKPGSRAARRSGQVADASPASQSNDSNSGVAAAAVRRRLARLGATRGASVNPVLEPLMKTVRTTHPKADLRLIERAYETAARMHAGQSRNSGDPYITHPLAVATILAELGTDPDTICAALLHDTVEDTSYTLGQLRQEFGENIAALVDGVTKLDKVKYGDAAQAETVRKMVVAMSRDIRVLVIKLADRLHNMRTLRYIPREKQEKKSREVLEIFAPLARSSGNSRTWPSRRCFPSAMTRSPGWSPSGRRGGRCSCRRSSRTSRMTSRTPRSRRT
jgi:GTP diphosphokinase / guanosine-3',5'-bis(diphosphate) 3'-diphosphatase